MSLSWVKMGWAMASSRSSPAAEASSPIRGPSTNRPWASRASIRWLSRATAIRCAVGRARPVALTSCASEAGPLSRADRTEIVLSRTPTPLELFMYRILPSRNARRKWKGEGVMGLTLAEKIWDAHVVRSAAGEPDLLYIDLHLVHEVTSPQAFDGLRAAGRKVRRPDLTIATEDHNVPTTGITGPGVPLTGPGSPVTDPVSRTQVEALRKNCAEFGIRLHPMGDAGQGIVHVIGPQLGLTQPGLTIVCGDSHTSTHGALGALAFGIGTSEVEHVLATQTLPQLRPKTMAITVNGTLPDGVAPKDLILAIIAKIGTGGGQGYVIEYRGSAVRALSMEGRLTVCNMSIEAGARAGLVAPDDVTFEYLSARPHAPKGADWDAAVARWKQLP